LVFFALIIGTIITVAAWKVHLPTLFLTVLVALIIASREGLAGGRLVHAPGQRAAHDLRHPRVHGLLLPGHDAS
jgi:hypothetical protein